MRSRRGWLVWLLLAVVILLLVVAAVSAVLYVVLRQQSEVESGWQDPAGSIVPGEITADWALYPLAGASTLETIDQAGEWGDLETAYAVLVFGLDLTDSQRIGRLLVLGEQFGQGGAGDRAALCYQQVYDLAVLSPSLNALARADALLGSGRGWAALEETAAALNAFDQVCTLAAESPNLQVAHRKDLLDNLRRAYRDLGAADRVERCGEQVQELVEEPGRPPVSAAESPELPSLGDPVSSPEVGELEDARRWQANALREVLAGGEEPPAEQVAELARALQAEDRAKTGLYEAELGETTQPAARINIQWHMIRWLTLKYQVAAGGSGLSIVPEWEAQLADIQSVLSKAYEGLFFDYEDLVTALPDVSLLGPGRYKVRRLVMLAGRLGQYPNFGEEQMASKLSDAVAELIASGSPNQLYVDWMSSEEGMRFILSPAGSYGQPAQAP
jgi:hypothetical protein